MATQSQVRPSPNQNQRSNLSETELEMKPDSESLSAPSKASKDSTANEKLPEEEFKVKSHYTVYVCVFDGIRRDTVQYGRLIRVMDAASSLSINLDPEPVGTKTFHHRFSRHRFRTLGSPIFCPSSKRYAPNLRVIF